MRRADLLLYLILSILSFSTFSFEYKITNESELNATEILNAQMIFSRVKNYLPEKIQATVPEIVLVEFKKLGDSEIVMSCGESKTVKATAFLGSTTKILNKYKIQLNRAFLLNYIDNSDKVDYACKHKNVSQEAIATLLHETMHLYEFNTSEKLSTSLTFQGHIYSLKNKLYERSVDAYEFSSAAEALAVNFEYFIMDPEFKCRKPSLYKYYQTHLDYTPYPNFECHEMTKLKLGTNGKLINIDLNRLYRIDYLLAGKGNDLMSRFGHSMIRLVMCSPGKAIGPSCLEDISNHIILSFRANTGNSEVSYIKGINGTYPSQLFVVQFSNVLDEYNKDELRDLFSFPLILSQDEQISLIQKILETHWTYSGKYYYLSNNCAVETGELIKSVLGEDHPFRKISANTPFELKKALVDSGLIKDFNADEENLNKQYFPSRFKNDLEFAFKNIQSSITKKNILTYEDYVNKTSSEERFEWYNSIPKIKKRSMSFFLLEKVIYKKYNEKISKRLANLLKENKIAASDVEILNEFSKRENILAPWKIIITKSYGLPLADEVDQSLGLKILEDYNSKNQDVLVMLKNYDPDFITEFDLILQNLKTFFLN